jgi:23S rRNA (guanosine2251-2'-O)-methyltransferase
VAASANYIFGFHPVMEALHSGKEIDKVFLKKGLRNEAIPGLIGEMRKKNIPFQFVPIEKLNRMCRKNHQGIIAQLTVIEYNDIEKLIPGLFEAGILPLILVLDHITDVRNMGAIARTAECAGFHALIVPSAGTAQINADAIKTSSGALHFLPVCRSANLTVTVNYLKNSGLQIISATEKAEQTLYQVDFNKPTALIMGSEDSGINNKLLQLSDLLIKIPLHGTISSLNVSVAASVIMYEAVRQRLYLKQY